MPVMDVAAAKRDGYSDEEILSELQRRSGVKMDVQSAHRDGYSVEEIAEEVERRSGASKREEIKARLKRAEDLRAQARNIETGSTGDGVLANLGAHARDILTFSADAGAGIMDAAGGMSGLGIEAGARAIEAVTGAKGLSGGHMDNWLRRGAKYIQESADQNIASPELRKQRQEIDDEVAAAGSNPEDGTAMRILRQAGARMKGIATNPLAAGDFMATQAGQMLIPMGGARVVGKLAARLGAGATGVATAATRGAVGVGAAVQGGSVAGGAYDDLIALPDEKWQGLPEFNERVAAGASPADAKEAIASKYAMMAGGVGALTSLLFNMKLGGKGAAQTTERVLAGAAEKPAESLAGKIGAAAKGVAAESLFSEPGEEVTGQLAQNAAVRQVDSSRGWTEGVGDAFGGAVLGGVAMGGPSAVGEQFFGEHGKPGAPEAPKTQAAPAVDSSPLDRPDPVAAANLAARAKERDADFAETVKARPELASIVDSWRKENPHGDLDTFIQHVEAEEASQKAQEAAAHPKVQEAEQGHAAAVAKLESGQAVASADPSAAPPPGVTAEESRDILQNGTGKLENEVKAAEENVRTVRQTVEKESDSGSVTEGLSDTVKKARDEAKANAGQLLKETQAAMLQGATEFDGKHLEKLAEESGMSAEAASQRVAAVKKRIDDKKAKEREKAAKEKARGGQGEQGRQTPAKAPSAPAATTPSKPLPMEERQRLARVTRPQEQPIKDGMVETVSGRLVPPPPAVTGGTDRKVQNQVRAKREWLRDMAVQEAESRGDYFNADSFRRMDPKNWAPANGDQASLYVFGHENAIFTSEAAAAPAPAETRSTPTKEGVTQDAIDGWAKSLVVATVAYGKDNAQAAFAKIAEENGLEAEDRGRLIAAFRNFMAERDGRIGGGPSTGGANDAQAQESRPGGGEAGADERTGGAPVAGEPGGELPGDAQAVPGGRDAGADAPAAGSGRPGEVRGDDGLPAGDAGGSPGDAGSSPRVPAGRLEQDVEHKSTPMAPGGNFRAADEGVETGRAGGVQQFEQNLEALKVLRLCEKENRTATLEEKRVLGKWNGWGPIGRWLYPDGKGYTEADKRRHQELMEHIDARELESLRSSTLNAHYTSPAVVDAMWEAVRALGFTGGTVVDPSMGSGIFFGRMPSDLMDSSKLKGIELERITAGISKLLYEQADIIQGGYESQRIPEGSADLHISNVPFGNITIRDKETGYQNRIHNFFFEKAVRSTRPGGLVVFITSKGSMDTVSGGEESFQREIDKKARLLGAVRLPRTAFEGSANTKVTTDIIVLQKRADGDAAGESWFERGAIAGKDSSGNPAQFEVNEYFVRNPDRILGEIRADNLYGEAKSVTDTGVFDTGVDLRKAIRDLLGNLPALNRSALHDQEAIRTAALVDRSIATLESETLPPKSVFEKDGTWYKTGDAGRAEPLEIAPKAAAALRSALPVRDALRNLLAAQLKGEDSSTQRARLNEAYDEFAKGGKTLNGMRRFLEIDEANAPHLMALEEKVNGKWTKAEIFEKNTQKKAERSQEAKTADDALLLSLDERGGVDIQFMSERSGLTEEQLLDALPGKLFRDPETRSLVLAETYLSGDVAAKLAVAENAGEAYSANAEALRAALPPEVAAEDVKIRVGAGWIGPAYLNQWLSSVGAGSRVSFNDATGLWTITERREQGFEFQADGVDSKFLLNCALNFKPTDVFVRDIDGNEVKDPKRSAVAKIVYDRFQAAFAEWMTETPERAEFVRKEFNRKLGGFANPKFDGSHLSFPGMAKFWVDRLRPHQRAAVWRILTWGSTILHHDVGTGKTATMIAGMMELKRTGKANKPMVVVPNHIVDQFGRDANEMYPGAKILVLGKKSLGADKRKTTLAKVATGDWDLVVVPHSSFSLMSMSPKILEKYAQEEIDALKDALRAATSDKSMDGRQKKQLQKRLDSMERNMEAKIEKLKADPGPFFDELGVDAMAIDEAHEFKNLSNVTKADRIKGVSVGDASKALDLFMKVRHLLALTGGRNLVFATGTPITRTVVETHTYLRFMAPGILKRMGCTHLDQFLTQFGAVSSEAALPPGGGKLRVEQQMKWQNVQQLSAAWSQVSDRVSARDTAIVRPKIKGGAPTRVTIPRHPMVGKIMDGIALAIERCGGKNEKGAPNVLSLMMRARKIALDPRLEDPNFPDLPGSKTNEAIRSVLDIYRAEEEVKGTQIIWCDLGVPKKEKGGKVVAPVDPESDASADSSMEEDEENQSNFDLYQDIKDKLVAGGIPAEQIQFIHDWNTDDKKATLFERVNNGDVRIVLASTRLMATGVNIQKRLAAMHHLDATWNPADMEQRNGRGIRQGNIYSDRGGVEIRYYSTEKTFDAYFWQTLERKSEILERFFSGKFTDREMEDASMGAMTAAQAKAEASGSPEMFEYVTVKRRVEELETAKREIESQAKKAKAQMLRTEDSLESAKARLELVPTKDPELTDFVVGGKKYETSGEVAEAIRTKYDLEGKPGRFIVGTLGGNQVVWRGGNAEMPNAPWGRSVWLSTPEDMDGTDVNLLIQNLSPTRAKRAHQSDIDYFESLLADQKKKSEQTFKESEELERVTARYLELHKKLMANEKQAANVESGEIEQPDDGTILSDLADLNVKGIRKTIIAKTKLRIPGIYRGEIGRVKSASVENQDASDTFDSWTPVAPCGGATIEGEPWILFRHLGESFGIPTGAYLQLAQGGAPIRVSPDGDRISSRGSETIQSVNVARHPAFIDYTPRLLRFPSQASAPSGMEGLSSFTPERLAQAAEQIAATFKVQGTHSTSEDKAMAAQKGEALRQAFRDVEAMESIAKELEGSAELIASGQIDASAAAILHRRLKAKCEAQGQRVHRAMRTLADAAQLIARADIAKRIQDAGLTFDLPRSWERGELDSAIAETLNHYQADYSLRYRDEGKAKRIVGYAAEQFFQAKGVRLSESTAAQYREWLRGEVTLNANRMPALAVLGAGLLGAYAVSPGAASYMAAGVAARELMIRSRQLWDKLTFMHSPRSQILHAVSINRKGVTGERIMEMLDQAQFRASEIAGPALFVMKRMSRAAKGEKVGELLSDFVESGAIPDRLRGLGVNAKAVLDHFKRKAEEAGLGTIEEGYLPRQYLHDGIAQAMKDKVARAALLADIIPKIQTHHPEWIQSRVDEGMSEAQAAEAAAVYLMDTLEGKAYDEEYNLQKGKNATRYESSHSKQRVVEFEIPRTVQGEDGPIALVERDFFKIMDRYIPSMSRTLAEKETVNPTEINSWLRGLQGEEASQDRIRLLGFIRNDLSGKLNRFLGKTWTERMRKIRMVNSVLYLGMSVWYPIRNFLFATPLAAGLTNFPSAAVGMGKGLVALPIMAAESLAGQPWVKGGAKNFLQGLSGTLAAAGKKVGVSSWQVEMAGAITQQVFDDAAGKTGKIARAIMYPSLLTQNAVDVWGFYSGRAYADRLLDLSARKPKAREFLNEALGMDAAEEAISSGLLTEEQKDRIGLYYKGLISGTSRSANLPSFMGNDVGRTVFQFGSIPMEQTRTLATKILPDPLRAAQFATGATLAGLFMLLKLWAAVRDPEDDKEEKKLAWIEESPGWQKFAYIMAQSGAPQMFGPGFEYLSGMGRPDLSVSEVLPMPTVSRVMGPGEAVLKGISSAAKAFDDGAPVGDIASVAAMPMVRELVNNQSSLPRSLGLRVGKSEAEEDLTGR